MYQLDLQAHGNEKLPGATLLSFTNWILCVNQSQINYRTHFLKSYDKKFQISLYILTISVYFKSYYYVKLERLTLSPKYITCDESRLFHGQHSGFH